MTRSGLLRRGLRRRRFRIRRRSFLRRLRLPGVRRWLIPIRSRLRWGLLLRLIRLRNALILTRRRLIRWRLRLSFLIFLCRAG